MVEVLFGEYIDGENCIQSVKLRERIDLGCKREVLYTPLDLYFLTRMSFLLLSECLYSACGRAENIAVNSQV